MSQRSALTKRGGTRQWRAIRARIIQRDKVCQICGNETNLHVDHIVPRSKGGTDHDENLWVLCRRCNLAKGGGFLVEHRTPQTPHALFTPVNGSTSHYQE